MFSADQLIIQKLNHVDINLKPRFLIKSGYYIVPSPSTALLNISFNKVDVIPNPQEKTLASI